MDHGALIKCQGTVSKIYTVLSDADLDLFLFGPQIIIFEGETGKVGLGKLSLSCVAGEKVSLNQNNMDVSSFLFCPKVYSIMCTIHLAGFIDNNSTLDAISRVVD